MSQNKQQNEDRWSIYEVRHEDFWRIRLHFGFRMVVFLACAIICVAALLPGGALSNGDVGLSSGLVLLAGYITAYRLSRPILAVSFAVLKWRIPMSVWKSLGVVAALAYAINSWDLIGGRITIPVFAAAGVLFFSIPLLACVVCVGRPGIGGAMIQMVAEHDTRRQKENK